MHTFGTRSPRSKTGFILTNSGHLTDILAAQTGFWTKMSTSSWQFRSSCLW